MFVTSNSSPSISPFYFCFYLLLEGTAISGLEAQVWVMSYHLNIRDPLFLGLQGKGLPCVGVIFKKHK